MLLTLEIFVDKVNKAHLKLVLSLKLITGPCGGYIYIYIYIYILKTIYNNGISWQHFGNRWNQTLDCHWGMATMRPLCH